MLSELRPDAALHSLLSTFALIFALSFSQGVYAAVTPPAQPNQGPGGSQYKSTVVTRNVYGAGSSQYWIFEPSNPAPVSAPVVIFNHGWGGMNPRSYGGWIDHIVKRGSIVIYPRYQESWSYPPDQITANAINAVKDAFIRLQKTAGHVRPEVEHVAVVGHSAGGQISANIAAASASSGIPQPKAAMCVEPGKSWNVVRSANIPLLDLSKIPSHTLLLTVVGDRDYLLRDFDAKRIFKETTQVPAMNKNFVILHSDTHGDPALIANHYAPCSFDSKYDSGERIDSDMIVQLHVGQQNIAATDALDYFGLWKLFDALCDAAFYGTKREFALGNTPQQRFMGTWSDGTPVKELTIVPHP